MEYPRPNWIYTLSSTMDISGNPATVVGPEEKLYFALSSKGTLGTVSTGDYAIVVGCVNGAGNLEWLFQDPAMTSNAEDTQPQIRLGSEGELYVAFVTPGNVPGLYNGADVISLCGGCGSPGRQDLVLARINGAVAGTPTLAWRIQNAYINSCNDEFHPFLYLDPIQNQLFVVYECSAATLCSSSVGSPNVVLVCLGLDGVYQWSYQGTLLNGIGSNQKPCLTTDHEGNIYIAYTITSSVGGEMQGVQDVEVIRIRRQDGLIVRDWILSELEIINSYGFNTDPYIVFDSNTKRLYLTFTATQPVPGGNKTASDSDLVIACITTEGALVFLHQLPDYNQIAYRYSSIDNPRIVMNQYGVLYIAAHAILESTGTDMIIVYKFNPGSGMAWFFRQGADEFGAYVAAADLVAPFQVLEVNAPFSVPSIATFAGQVYLSFVRFNSATLYITGLAQNLNYLEYTAQQYMRNVVTIC